MRNAFHAHVCFDASTRPVAERVREALRRQFSVRLGALRDSHFEVDIEPQQFDLVVSWLMLNRDGLSIFVHPMTGSFWMGDALLTSEACHRFD